MIDSHPTPQPHSQPTPFPMSSPENPVHPQSFSEGSIQTPSSTHNLIQSPIPVHLLSQNQTPSSPQILQQDSNQTQSQNQNQNQVIIHEPFVVESISNVLPSEKYIKPIAYSSLKISTSYTSPKYFIDFFFFFFFLTNFNFDFRYHSLSKPLITRRTNYQPDKVLARRQIQKNEAELLTPASESYFLFFFFFFFLLLFQPLHTLKKIFFFFFLILVHSESETSDSSETESEEESQFQLAFLLVNIFFY